MLKVLLMFAAIGLLAVSTGITYTRPQGAARGPDPAGAAILSGAADVARTVPAEMQRALNPVASDANEHPAPALLVYLACIVVGSAIGISLVWRKQREL